MSGAATICCVRRDGTASGAKNIGRVRVNPGGFFELEFAADSNQLFTVLGSTNLLNWTPLGILCWPVEILFRVPSGAFSVFPCRG